MITCNDFSFFFLSPFFFRFHLRDPSFVILFCVSPFSRNEMNNNNICCHVAPIVFYITLFIPGLSFLSFFRSLTISHSHSHSLNWYVTSTPFIFSTHFFPLSRFIYY